MIFASILLILFQQSFCQRVVIQDVAAIQNIMCPTNKSEAAIKDFQQATNTKLDALEKKISNVFDILASVRLVVGYSACRTGYEYYQQDKFCYKFHSDCKTWSEARSVCQEEGGDLISLKQGSFEYFRSVVKQQTGACNGAWVGATDVSSPGDWNWLNGDVIANIFWSTDQPDNWQGVEHCADMMRLYDFYMNDEKCNSTAHFLCQIV
ncbi:hypothetical protein ACJMK2_032056 [Sinanodonta woodiana]|uniref:C-type lectin domain-containing protein n=1 Tax=Sinanodonta woodiana TaxID=1069815 RepID=A0ABD3X0P1_SINWO